MFIIFVGTIIEIYMSILGGGVTYAYIDYAFVPITYLTRLYYIIDLLTTTPEELPQIGGKRFIR